MAETKHEARYVECGADSDDEQFSADPCALHIACTCGWMSDAATHKGAINGFAAHVTEKARERAERAFEEAVRSI